MKYQAIRGMHDLMGEPLLTWQLIEHTVREWMRAFQYHEIRFPLLESTDVFRRTLGDTTDIVEKEMYTFLDRNGDSLTLRPEGTAGCVRAAIQAGILRHQIQRLWYAGPMFRHERPQKGRMRQFHQVGAELFGVQGATGDVEIIQLSAALFKALGIESLLRLEINSLGLPAERIQYRQQLIEYFEKHRAHLDEESLTRLYKNPLRLLDSKNPAMQAVIAEAPTLIDALGEASKAHFGQVQALLTHLGIPFVINPRLVRGLDYYAHTVFEWVTDALGAQGTVCAGGRYDGLIDCLGGEATGAVGFALGMERLAELVGPQPTQAAHVCVLALSAAAQPVAMALAQTLRTKIPGLRVENFLEGSAKSQFKKADKSGADFALIIGDDEMQEGAVAIKALRDTLEQARWPVDETLFEFLAQQCLSVTRT